MTTVVEARGLTKVYGTTRAVDGVDFTLQSSEIVGLLGPNGAGKTTTILMLLGLTEPSAGTISVLGHDPLHDPLEVKRRVGYLPDAVGFYDHMSARENLLYTARLAGLTRREAGDRIATALSRVRLTDVADRPVGSYSRGMRQRLGLAEVIMKSADVAILDEPTSGLDPQSTYELLDMIRELRQDKVSVLLSSHLLDRVQSVCDRVLLFQQGKIALQGTVPELARQVLGGGYAIQVETQRTDVYAALDGIPGIREIHPEGGGRFRVIAESDLRSVIATRLVGSGADLLRLNVVEPSLDDIYARHFASRAAA
ncbi:MAG TPA: ABC transporter ATP-binding protein [Alphaproteobacteria bacterium]|jgi:ABC-2 type transport system ATP-binding protein|nr:ABC transporter ATP-binding protein [Alphaproteobacteria bacterium]